MPAIAVASEVAKCHRCDKEAILDGHGRCVECFDKEVDGWNPPAVKPPIKTDEWRARNKIWQKKYYEAHKAQCIRRSVECARRRKLEHPELLIKDRELHRKIRESNRHPCIDCGNPCNKESRRCKPCYHEILRGPYNPIRGSIRAFWEEKTAHD